MERGREVHETRGWVETAFEENTAILKLYGAFEDYYETDEKLRQALFTAVTSAIINRVVIDCEQLTDIDTTGLAAIISGSMRAKEMDKSFVLRNTKDNLNRLLRLSDLEDYFMIERTPEDS